jgi:hypothetical protein
MPLQLPALFLCMRCAMTSFNTPNAVLAYLLSMRSLYFSITHPDTWPPKCCCLQVLRSDMDAVVGETLLQASHCMPSLSHLLSPSLFVEFSTATACALALQALRDDKDAVESEIASLAAAAAKDLGLILDKTIKLEWHKVRRM